MIRGYFYTAGVRRRPFVQARFDFPSLNRSLEVPLLVDTGADRTIIAPLDANRLGLDLSTLSMGQPSTGVGGQMNTRLVEALVTLDDFSTTLTLTILEPLPERRALPIPSLLGRDIISRFALFIEERTNRVLLLEPEEADALNIPL